MRLKIKPNSVRISLLTNRNAYMNTCTQHYVLILFNIGLINVHILFNIGLVNVHNPFNVGFTNVHISFHIGLINVHIPFNIESIISVGEIHIKL